MTTINRIPYRDLRPTLTSLQFAGQSAVYAIYGDGTRKPDELAAAVVYLTDVTKVRGASRKDMVVQSAAWYTYCEKLLLHMDAHPKLAADIQTLLLQCGWVRAIRDHAIEMNKNV